MSAERFAVVTVRRTRQRFLSSLEADDFQKSCALLPGYVVVGDHSPKHVTLRLVPNRHPDGQPGYTGEGATPMEALRDAAWKWLDARKISTEPTPSPARLSTEGTHL